MNLLAKDHILLIESDVESARITLSNLSDELVDHICCEVEELMIQGKSFEEAYAVLKDQTGIKVLQQIQENTLYLIDKKYRLMKTTMKITGNVSLALLALGTLFKIFHWPGAGPMLVIGFGLLCFFFFPAAVYTNNREGGSKGNPLLNGSILIGGILLMMGILFKVMHWPGSAMLLVAGWVFVLFLFLPVLLYVKLKEAVSSREKRIYILGVVALVVFELSTMFKMMHWPGAGPLMILGSIMLVGIFLPMYTHMRFKNAELKTGQFVYLITLSMYAVVLTALLAMNVSKDILGCFVRENSNTSEINRYLEKKRAHQAQSQEEDSIRVKATAQIHQVSQEAAAVKNLIRDMQLTLVQETDQVDKVPALAAISETGKIVKKENYDMVNHVLLWPEGNNRATALKNKLDAYRKQVLTLTVSDNDLSKSIADLLSTNVAQAGIGSWENMAFANNPLISTLELLSTLEKNVSLVESVTIQHIQHSTF